MGIGIMLHYEIVTPEVTTGAFMSSHIEILQITCAYHRLRISPAGLKIDPVRFACVGTNAGLKIQ